MWTVVYVAEGSELAKKIKDKLQQEGFLIKVKVFSKNSKSTSYAVLAPEFEAADIQSVLLDLGY